jgi:hypothetical protein
MSDEAKIPGTAGADAPAAPADVPPTRVELRKLVMAALRSDTELSAFTLDRFQDTVHFRFTNGMDRVAKVTLLLQHADPRKLHAELLRVPWFGYVPRPWRVPIRWAAAVLAVAAVLGVGYRYRIPSAGDLAEAADGIAIVGEWVATPRGDGVCTALKKIDPDRGVACVRGRFIAGAAETLLQGRARDAGALVVATVEGDRMRLRALGQLGRKGSLFDQDFKVDLHVVEDLGRVAVLLEALARAAAPRPSAGKATRIPCAHFGTRPLDQVGLLSLLVVPACEGERLEKSQYLGRCGNGPEGDADAWCALRRYLFGRDHRGQEALDALQEVRAPVLRRAANLALAREHCRQRDLNVNAAEKDLAELLEDASRCEGIRLAGLAACIVTKAPGNQVAPWVAELERTTVGADDARACPAEQIGESLATRAYWRRQRKQWLVAAADDEEAFRYKEDPSYLLGAAEGLLHLGDQATQVKALVERARPLIEQIEAQPKEYAMVDGDAVPAQVARAHKLRVRAALLRWRASRQQADTKERADADRELGTLYDGLDGKAAPIGPGDEDPDLEALVCGDAKPCVYENLKERAPEALNKTLGPR